eukprot:gnl/TRDRNA2_/TRDRNA2_90544_c0_seq1.p1 gnl/TRDRNA2_/TRDRNA2_90544_c0~~gnl/TRDRNA2_/TRDRNA2_90544_c0_seq1.p1  ORF type:complete len:102 (-),score=18.59 gnl/TRDRNA2_/TRDRNA2_90544_c0_seq1:57-362(-)
MICQIMGLAASGLENTIIDLIVAAVIQRANESERQEYTVLCTGKFSTPNMRDLLAKFGKQLPNCEVYVVPCSNNGKDYAVKALQTVCPKAAALNVCHGLHP